MFDLFGLRKAMESPPADPGPGAKTRPARPPDPAPRPASTQRGPEEPATPASGRKRLWAVLLLLDTVLVFVFGGALAGMIFVRWATPTAPPRSEPRRAEPKRAEPKRPPEPPKAPEAKAPEPPKASAKAEGAKGPVGRPGVSAPDLPRRESEPVGSKNGGAARRETAAVRPESKPRAVSVDFQCPGPDATEVLLKGPFLVRTGGIKSMQRGEDGVWRTSVSLLPGTYRYWCVTDGRRSEARSITAP